MTFPYGPYAGPITIETEDKASPDWRVDVMCWEWLAHNVGDVRHDTLSVPLLKKSDGTALITTLYPCVWFATADDALLYQFRWSGKLWDRDAAMRIEAGLVG